MDEQEPEQEYKVYRGHMTKLSDLKDFPVFAQRVSPEPEHKLPRLMVIQSIIPSWRGGYKNVTVRTEEKMARFDLPQDYTLNVLTGRRGKALSDWYTQWAMKNAGSALVYNQKTIGADPELFIEDARGNVIPAWTFLGSKAKPTKSLSVRGETLNLYWDGFQAEFDTPPHSCLAFFVDAIQGGLRGAYSAAQAKFPGSKLSIRNVVPIDDEVLASAANEHVEFGCMPSKNAYGLRGNTLPGRKVPFRFAGGHIHLGVQCTPDTIIAGVKGMDALLGVACTSLFASFDNPVRREFYGLPGEYRLPAHGVEYRTLSNAWLMHPVITHMVYELARVSFDYGTSKFNLVQGTEGEIVDIIRGSDVEKARVYMERNKTLYLALLNTLPPFKKLPSAQVGAERVFNVLLQGAETLIAEPDNLVRNWRLDSTWKGHSDGPNCNWGISEPTLLTGGKL